MEKESLDEHLTYEVLHGYSKNSQDIEVKTPVVDNRYSYAEYKLHFTFDFLREEISIHPFEFEGWTNCYDPINIEKFLNENTFSDRMKRYFIFHINDFKLAKSYGGGGTG